MLRISSEGRLTFVVVALDDQLSPPWRDVPKQANLSLECGFGAVLAKVLHGDLPSMWFVEAPNLAVCAVFRCYRPGLHRGANYLLQFLPTRAAGREDRHSVND